MKVQKLNRRQARWALYLSRFNFTLKHVPEIKMKKADRLSRGPDWKVEAENDNNNQIFIKDHWIHSLSEVVIEELKVDILEKMKIAGSKDKKVVRVVEEMKKAEVMVLRGEEWQIEKDLVLKEKKIYVPKNEELRAETIQLHHDKLVAGHGGRWKTTELVMRDH